MSKTRAHIYRIIWFITKSLLCLSTFVIYAQSIEKQIIRVEKMEYAFNPNLLERYNKVDPIITSRVVLANDPLVAEKMRLIVLSAINNRWNSIVLNPKWEMKSIILFNKPPRFKSKLQKGIPGSWHLFFQVIDNGPYPIDQKHKIQLKLYPDLETLDYAPYNLKIKALIVDGSNEAVIFSNEMTILLQRTKVPVGQILLQRVPALTDSFLQAFDKAIQQFFSEPSQKELTLEITPACLFLGVDKVLANAQKLNFVSKNDSVIEQLQFKHEWVIQNFKTKKIKRVNNWGRNITNMTINIFLGLPTNHITAEIYNTKFGFLNVNENKYYSCEIPFTEEYRVESDWRIGNNIISEGGSESTTRIFDSSKKNYILCEKDTIGSFKIAIRNSPNYKNRSSQCWDGKNEFTIVDIPESWITMISNQNNYPNPYILEGELYNTPFRIEKSLAGNQLDIEINGQEMATLKIYNNKPVLGLLYSNPTDEKVFNVLMMLSTLPFNSIL